MTESEERTKKKEENKVKYAEKDVHLEWMEYAYTLSWNASPVKDAYCVGCVIVDPSTNRLVTFGYSREMAGNTHAEECALRKLTDIKTKDAKCTTCQKLDMYATMEPCSVRLSGNRPCVESILMSGRIGRVFIGVMEPSTLVKCTGTQKLLSAGLDIFIVRDPSNLSRIRDLCLDPNRHITEKTSVRVRPRRESEIADLMDKDFQNAYTTFLAEPIQPVEIKTMASEEVRKRAKACAAIGLQPSRESKDALITGIFLRNSMFRGRDCSEKSERVKRELVFLSQALMRDTKILVEEKQLDGTTKPCTAYLKHHNVDR